MNEAEQATERAAEQGEQQFVIQRIYLKDMSLEIPKGVAAFVSQDHPNINQDLNAEVNKINEHLYETVLKLTVTAMVEEETIFLIEVQQAGLFMIQGLEGKQLARVLNTMCPQILFPYAREMIDSTLIKATFPPLMLPPVNFEGLYSQALASKENQKH